MTELRLSLRAPKAVVIQIVVVVLIVLGFGPWVV